MGTPGSAAGCSGWWCYEPRGGCDADVGSDRHESGHRSSIVMRNVGDDELGPVEDGSTHGAKVCHFFYVFDSRTRTTLLRTDDAIIYNAKEDTKKMFTMF